MTSQPPTHSTAKPVQRQKKHGTVLIRATVTSIPIVRAIPDT
ncbi:MAG: hypothetical protein VB075_13805 [Petrimonas sp.]|nr:hypothetical protein [Petrimonas sp.]MEA4979030.1 hypothetical protein [Petrimonas sp.]MEA5045624.1 hypothetical protein [Petrimonas sp.]